MGRTGARNTLDGGIDRAISCLAQIIRCAFGRKNLATRGLEKRLACEREAGAILAIDVGVSGLADASFTQ
jgi:hypothetical protein